VSRQSTDLDLSVRDGLYPDPTLERWTDFEQAARAAVSYLHRHVGMDVWLVTRVADDLQLVVAAGGSFPISVGDDLGYPNAYCRRMVARQGPTVAPDVLLVPAYAEVTYGSRAPVRAYVGMPLHREDGSLYGTLCGFATTPQPASLYTDADVVRLVATMLSTILARQDAERSAWQLAERDRLTGVRNRRGWHNAPTREQQRQLRHGGSMSVLALDLDGLKRVNDERGHRCGDALLVSCAGVMEAISRPGDTVARLGGDEFALLAVQCDADCAQALLTRFHAQLRSEGIAVSVGVATRRAGEELDDEAAGRRVHVRQQASPSWGSRAERPLDRSVPRRRPAGPPIGVALAAHPRRCRGCGCASQQRIPATESEPMPSHTSGRRRAPFRRRAVAGGLAAALLAAGVALAGPAAAAPGGPGGVAPVGSSDAAYGQGPRWGDDSTGESVQAGRRDGVWRAEDDQGSTLRTARRIGADALWRTKDPRESRQRLTGVGVGVALVDTGVAPVEGLRTPGRVVNGPDLSFDSQDDSTAYLDGYGHGTHLAGIIAGRDASVRSGQEGKDWGFVGIAPDATLVNVKVGAADGAVDVTQVIAAIDWVVQHRAEHGVRVLNLSYGTPSRQGSTLDPLAHAVENAWRAGIVVVVAAGNDGAADGEQPLTMPAADPYVLSVGSSDHRGTGRAGDDVVGAWSNEGTAARRPDIVAPGKSLVSLRVPGGVADTAFPTGRVSTDPSGRLFRGTGTSQSAAVVSGAVALLLQRAPWLTPDRVKALLVASADPLAADASPAQGAGEVDLVRALRLLDRGAVPAARQAWPRSTGLGSLGAARGDIAPVDPVTGEALTGERDIFGAVWDAAAWAAASDAGTAWSGGSWRGGPWTGAGWTDGGWTRMSWSRMSWSRMSWSGGDWTRMSWSGMGFARGSWSGDGWTRGSWSATDWNRASWSDGSWYRGSWSSDRP